MLHIGAELRQIEIPLEQRVGRLGSSTECKAGQIWQWDLIHYVHSSVARRRQPVLYGDTRGVQNAHTVVVEEAFPAIGFYPH